jgi:hypothetical protein
MINFLKDYNSLPNFLLRTTILSYKKLHIRLHTILSEDKSPYLHNHPFYFISIILKGGYVEELLLKNGEIKHIKHKIGSIIVRTPNDYHRILSINGETKTFFITWKVKMDWRLKDHPNMNRNEFNLPKKTGIFIRNVKGKEKFCKFDKYWYIGNDNIEAAERETRYSIHQITKFKEI